MYAKIENGKIVDTSTNIKSRFPNTSFPKGIPPEEYQGWFVVKGQPVIPEGKVIDQETIVVVDGKPVYNYTYRDKTQNEKQARWQGEMNSLDAQVPRYVEDLIDALITKGVIVEADLPESNGKGLKLNYAAKKTKRGEKPV